ncbi:MAG: CHAT domain-containing protein [Okeania sp. SIO3I5]|uniref:CHAT domain-containing protein n=1 Tax=Okeania sp. SIO3I5 TaxID=2607805 RepID=UPI0013BD1C2A|nr:CHAT domain-containing tetratricopeptide repeat protein [Okeania sp. SIO3I5]NEQ35067.1 CHAT domain-containing protein [Okeania sp. SIO3I5]
MIYQNPERGQKYLFLIEQLLRSPQGQHESILGDNSELLDAGLIEMIRQRAEAEQNMGNIQNYELLNSIADRLNENLPSSFSSNLDREKKQNIESSSSDNFNQPETQQKIPQLPEVQQRVLFDIFKNIEKYGVNTEIIYPILQKHLPQFNLEFAENLRRWATANLYKNSTQDAHTFASFLVNLSFLILYYPLGDKAANIAMVRAGYESALTFFTREKFPEAYAELMINLGIAIEEDPLADSVEKWEEAIACYQTASQIFTREVNPEKWTSIQDNLGNAYRNRQQGEIEINLQQSITFYQDALQIFNPERHPKVWGCVQHNLGNSYAQLFTLNLKESQEDNEQFLEAAINCYEQALQTLTKNTYSDLWALTELSLGQAYCGRLRGNPYDNYEKAQQCFENALLVYTPQTYPFYYQQVKDGKQQLQKFITFMSERDSNIEIKEDFSFIIELLKLTLASQGDPQKVFPFLEKNLGELNQEFPKKLLVFIASLRSQDKNTLLNFMEAILQFSDLIMVFPKGEMRININVAIIGFQLVLEYISKDKNLQQDSESSSLIGSIKLSLGAAFYERYENRWGDYLLDLEETIKYFEEGFAVLNYEKDPNINWLAYCQNLLGNVYVTRNQIQGDYDDIEKAIKAYKSALKADPENTLRWAMVQMNLGIAYGNRQGNPLHNLNQAIECYEKSLIVRKQETYPIEWADVQKNLGSAYRKRGMLGHSESAEDMEKAIECDKNALKVYDDPSKYPKQWGALQQNLGNAYSDRRKGNSAENLELAIDHMNQSLKVRTKEADPYEWAITQKNLGAIYLDRKLGGRGDRITNFKLVIECYEKALQVLNLEKYPVDWAKTQHNLVACYKNLADFVEPRKNLKKAIEYGTNVINQDWVRPQQLAKTQFELGTCYKNLALKGEEREKNLTLAIKSYQDALRVISRESQPHFWANIKNSLGNAYQHNGQYQDAINSYQNALLVYTRKTFPTDYIKTVINIGNAHAKYEKLTDAFNSYQEAINVFEDLLYQLATDDDAKRKLGEEWVKIYQLMVSTCLKLGKEKPKYYATAWQYVERSKTRRLVEIFAQTKPADVSDTDWQEFQDLRNQITNEQKWIEDKEKSIILLGESVEKPELDTRKIILNNLKQQLNKKLEITPKLASRQKVQYTPFSKLGEKLSDDYTAIIQWYILEADEKFCAFIYNHQSFQPYVWESSFKDLNNLQQWYEEYFLTYNQFIEIIKFEAVSDSFEELKQRMITKLASMAEDSENILPIDNHKYFLLNYVANLKKPDQWIDELPERLNRLAEILHIDDLLNYLPPNCQQVILIPHRFLHLFPIHALPIKPETWQKFNPNYVNTNQTNYLFECFSKGVRYAPSCQTLLMLEKQKCPNFERLLAIGNPTQDSDLAELCVNTVDKFWKQQKPQSQPEVLCGSKATKDALINQLQDYLQNCHTLLYSGHGSFESESPIDSGLILHDHPLELREIFGLNLQNCRLVTLIACEAAMTDAGSITDEYIGLPSAFLWAGVSGIVSALWAVEQKASVFLGIKLYQNLLAQTEREKDVIKALNEAQLWLRTVNKNQLLKWIKDSGVNVDIKDWLKKQNKQPFSNPYYWAAFCVIGK